MLPPSLLSSLKALAFAQKQPLPAAAVDPAQKGAQFELGQKLQGAVQAQMAPGLFKVRVADQMMQMQLPATMKSGDTVALQVVATQPKLTLSIINSALPLSTPEKLGSAARLLSSLSQHPPEKAQVRAPQTTPLWDKPNPPEGKQLVGMLREAVSNSGLFYESHQAQWLEGGRSTEQLLREPQNFSPEQARMVAAGGALAETKSRVEGEAGKAVSPNKTSIPDKSMAGDKSVVADKMAMLDKSPSLPMAIVLTDNSSSAAMRGDLARADMTSQSGMPTALPEGKPLNIPEHLQPLVQQQLNALETNQMVWQGNVWPGQTMQWEVHEQGSSQGGAENGQRQWVTQLSLNLPNLGEVVATLRLNSAGLSLTLNAETQEVRTKLGSASSQLVHTLSEAGIPVLNAQVKAP